MSQPRSAEQAIQEIVLDPSLKIVPHDGQGLQTFGCTPETRFVAHIDPGADDKSDFLVDFRNVTPAMLARATNDGKLLEGVSPARRAEVIFGALKKLAELEQTAVQSNSESESAKESPVYPDRQRPTPPAEGPFRKRSWRPELDQPQSSPRVDERAPARPTRPRTEEAAPPEILATFEVEGMGTFESYYHHVARGEDFIVLAFDRRSRASRFHPEPGDDKALYFTADNLPDLYQVQAVATDLPGPDFWELVVLYVQRAIPKNSMAAEMPQ